MAQDDSLPQPDHYWRFMFSGGLIRQSAQTMAAQPNIKSAFTPDVSFFISLYSDHPRAGWMIDAGTTTKNCRYYITYSGNKNDYSVSNSRDRYYQIGLKKTYRINLNKYLQGMLAFGPHIIFNPIQSNHYADFTYSSASIDKINIAQTGAGFDVSAYLLQRFYKTYQFLLCINYQRGFFGLYETDVYHPNQFAPATYRFYGTGAGLKLGVLF